MYTHKKDSFAPPNHIHIIIKLIIKLIIVLLLQCQFIHLPLIIF